MILVVMNAIHAIAYIKAWKSQDFNRVWTRDLAIPVRRSNQLNYVSGFIVQLVRLSHRYREVTGWNPVEVLTFSGFYIRNCINCVHNCGDHSLFDKTKSRQEPNDITAEKTQPQQNIVDSRQNKLDSWQNKLDSRQNKLDSRQNKLDSRQNKLDSRQNKLDSRQNKLDSRQNKLDSRLDSRRKGYLSIREQGMRERGIFKTGNLQHWKRRLL